MAVECEEEEVEEDREKEKKRPWRTVIHPRIEMTRDESATSAT